MRLSFFENSVSMPVRSRKAERGSALGLLIALMVVLIGFLGMTIYTGLNSYLQNELQAAVSSAAGAGATAMFDKFDGNGNPIKSEPESLTAATNTFNSVVAINPTLQNYGAVLMNGTPTIDAARQTVTIEAQVVIPTPFLTLVGIPEYTLESAATARYARRDFSGGSVSVSTTSSPLFNTVELDPPIVDGPGADIIIETAQNSAGGFHGVMVEVCTSGKCYDVTRAAKASSGGAFVVDRAYPGGLRRVLYGKFNIDLSATGSDGYNESVKKGSSIRIVDDGVHDYITAAGTRGVELKPSTTTLSELQILHYATFCPEPAFCNLPTGFVGG